MLNIIIGILHLLLGIFVAFYVFIIPKNVLYDFLFILYILANILSWIIYDDQCFVTYYYNKLNNIKKDKKITDMNGIINENSFLWKFGFILTTIFTIISIYIASIRSKIMSPLITIIVIVLRYVYVFYHSAVGFNYKSCHECIFGKEHYVKIYSMYKNTGLHNAIKPYFNNIIFGLNVLILIYIFYKNKSRLL